MNAPTAHFDDLSPAEQQSLIARIHPSLLESGMWVSPGEPREDELKFWRDLPETDAFRRAVAKLIRPTQKEGVA